MKGKLMIPVVTLLLGACAAPPIYNWNGYDNAVYSYTKAGDERSVENLFKVYDNLIKHKGSSGKPAPGVCADYGYLLLKKGEKQKGIDLLKMEVQYYPESARFVNLIIRRAEQ